MDHKILEALAEGPDIKISDQFGQKVIRKIEKRERIAVVRQILLQTFGILTLAVMVFACLIYFMGMHFVARLLPYAGWGAMLVAVLITIQYLDGYLVQRKWQNMSVKN